MRLALRSCLLLAAILTVSVHAPALAQESTPSPRAARIHEDLNRILTGPDFAITPQGESPLQKAAHWMREKWDNFWKWWDKLFRFGGSAGAGTAQVAMYVVLAALILGIAYVLAFGIRKLG